MMKVRKGHIPIRTCVSCGTRRRKRELLRLVLDAQGVVVVDKERKAQSRGAYVCPSEPCITLLGKSERLRKAFGSDIEIEEIGVLQTSEEDKGDSTN